MFFLNFQLLPLHLSLAQPSTPLSLTSHSYLYLLQGLHFSFSAGALLAPAAIGQLGYRTVFLSFGLLALPTGVVCCLAAPAAAAAAASASGSAAQSAETRAKHHLLVDKLNEQSLWRGNDDGHGNDDDSDSGGHANEATIASGKRGVEMVAGT